MTGPAAGGGGLCCPAAVVRVQEEKGDLGVPWLGPYISAVQGSRPRGEPYCTHALVYPWVPMDTLLSLALN